MGKPESLSGQASRAQSQRQFQPLPPEPSSASQPGATAHATASPPHHSPHHSPSDPYSAATPPRNGLSPAPARGFSARAPAGGPTPGPSQPAASGSTIGSCVAFLPGEQPHRRRLQRPAQKPWATKRHPGHRKASASSQLNTLPGCACSATMKLALAKGLDARHAPLDRTAIEALLEQLKALAAGHRDAFARAFRTASRCRRPRPLSLP
jgi:hypothetical protein